ncbi:hypothetical protein NLJ89_g3521 [Agrocybe chaxingu]|uniref:DNA polymerase n=1 Tax=Agrocybe chaxingu TaxID=84603 RepID=A0A9W8K4K1_9AGAR|nr:hypothetical protein NLJ89_g3521 [Agrocybe chaxingu]
MPVEHTAAATILKHPKGSVVEILAYGATVVSWKVKDQERLFVSSKAFLDGSKPVRGGIPVVFPCFGAPTHPEHSKLTQHGFARNEVWKFESIVMDNEAGVSVRFILDSDSAHIKELYSKPFKLAYVITLAEHQLSTNLHVQNTSTSDPLEFQALLHTYIRAPADDVRITPLKGLSYYDKTESTQEARATPKTETRDEILVKNFTDSVYENAPLDYKVVWPSGGVHVRAKGFKDVVIWNPQEEGQKIGDMEVGGCMSEIHDSTTTSRNVPGPRLQVRINQIDYTLVPPGALDNSSLPRVPVIRIYGSSSIGKTSCVHVHQVYPYVFVEYFGKLSPRDVKRYVSKLLRSLNHAVAFSLKRDPDSPKSQFIRGIVLVKGIPFYGFHASYQPFLKIFAGDPAHIHRITAILQSGTVMSTRFRVYESHLSYVLQFLCDFGLYGCGTIDLEDALERCADDSEENAEPVSSDEATTVKFPPSSYFRESRVALEVDVIAPHILNRHRLMARTVPQKAEMPAPPLPSEPLVLGVRELWDDERRHRQEHGLNPSPEMPIDPSESSRAKGVEWVSEARWWDEIAIRIQREQEEYEPRPYEDHSWERFVMTTFESVEALWESQYKTWKPAKRPTNEDASKPNPDLPLPEAHWQEEDEQDAETKEDPVDVDMSMLSDQEMIQLDQEDQEQDWNEEGPAEADIDEAETYPEEDEEDQDIDLQDNGQKTEDSETSSPIDPFSDSPVNEIQTRESYHLNSPPTPTRGVAVDKEGSPTPTKHSNGNEIHVLTAINNQGSDVTEMPTDIANIVGRHTGASNLTIDQVEDQPMAPGTRGPDLDAPKCDAYPPVLTAKERFSLITARAVHLSKAFDSCKTVNTNRYTYSLPPPSRAELNDNLQALGLPSKIYQPPYYSKDCDIPEVAKEYAGLSYRLKGGQGIATLDEWSSNETSKIAPLDLSENSHLDPLGVGGWEYASHPPSVKAVRRTMNTLNIWTTKNNRTKSQIEGPTQANIYGFKTSPTGGPDKFRDRSNMSVMSLEIFVPTQGTKVPNPEEDQVAVVVYALHLSGMDVSHRGILILNIPPFSQKTLPGMKFQIFDTELDLLNGLVDLVVDLDPDMLAGWELQLSSWGYLEIRGQTNGISISDLVSRAPPRQSVSSMDSWSLRKSSTFKVAGRQVLNLWRIMRSEKNLTSYTFENVVFSILHRREFARVFGVDFFSVLTRGSQFKVESFMFRIAKPESFVLISPSKNDVGRQNAAECMPLIMEPASAFYTSPLLVLDFQSLYPSIMIAYNYCYSTCLGRVVGFKGKNKFGVIDDLDIPPHLLEQLRDRVTVAPNGILYVKSTVRKGLLGRMLAELLDTRVMVKQAMRRVGSDKARRRALDARQLSLKYIANVTYGYTSASFSGRMPAVEIADSIVQSGRETLEKAIETIDGTKKWGARVLYGDTDSVFVYLPGRTKEQAFSIGNEIAEAITAMNPAPVKLKFEKVYLPCVLMAKKRYVGFKFENVDDTEPAFDAKGIETVRRDGVLAQRKMVENCLNDKGPPPPGVMVAARRAAVDPHDEPQYGDRIPYVIAQSTTGVRLVDRAMDPLEFVNNSQIQLDAMYYITRVLIPPLERIFNLMGADVKQWFNEIPRISVPELVSPRKVKAIELAQGPDRMHIGEHFLITQCLSCGDLAPQNCPWFYARRKAEAGTELFPLFEELLEGLEELEMDGESEGDQSEGEEWMDYHTYGDDSPYASDNFVDSDLKME